jgi:transcriptional regulator
LAASLGVGCVIATQLWRVSPYDPATLIVVPLLRLVTGLVACLGSSPPGGARRSDPVISKNSICDPLTFYRGRPNLPVESLQESVLSPEQTNLLQGTLDMVILKALRLGEMHGLGISRRIEQISQGTFVVKSGSLFPALRRMQEEGWISSAWGESETNRRAKYYRLTKAGVKQLEEETAKWERIVLGISRTLEAS